MSKVTELLEAICHVEESLERRKAFLKEERIVPESDELHNLLDTKLFELEHELADLHQSIWEEN